MLLASNQLFTSPSRALLSNLIVSKSEAGGFSPARIAGAYGYAPLSKQRIDGTGETVALVEVDRYLPSDLQTFDQRYGLPQPAVTEYFSGGTAFPPASGPETSLDVEWVHALAPGAAIQIFYVDDTGSVSNTWSSMAAVLREVAGLGDRIVSISLDACRPGSGLEVARAALADLAQRKVSVFVSSGDNGDRTGPAFECGRKVGVAYPSGDPSVVSVGGTSLRLRGNGYIAREIAWKHSGGGRFVKLQRALWQLAPSMPRDQYRWVPDVAFLGDPGTGVNFVVDGAWKQVAGTSLGAPAWAAAWALVLEKATAAGKAPDAAQRVIYGIANSPSYKTAFHDIVSGSNGRYRAGPGWDAVTGWGSPNVAALADAVIAMSPPP
jgi:kumamolisin